MIDPRFILLDDDVSRGWEPYALTRPGGEMVFGALTMRERFERMLGTPCAGHLTAAHLKGFAEPGAAPVLDVPEIAGPALVSLSRFVPDWSETALRSAMGSAEAVVFVAGGRSVGRWIPAGETLAVADILAGGADSARRSVQVAGRLLEHVWELCLDTPPQIGVDIDHLCDPRSRLDLPAGVHLLGENAVYADQGALIEPGVVFDTSGGPIWLREGARVRALTRLAGPAYIGPDSTILGGSVEAVSIGPVCKIRGEIADTVCLGYVNKAHDGHMGHAYLGRWVNLGAETTNSDLKNNYGTIRIDAGDGPVDTGEIKLGCLLGDHVKTGIGLLLNTGTVVGAGSNLFGSEMPPKWVAPFRWGQGEALVPFRLEKFLEVVERAMERRSVKLDDAQRDQLRASWRRGCAQAGDSGEAE